MRVVCVTNVTDKSMNYREAHRHTEILETESRGEADRVTEPAKGPWPPVTCTRGRSNLRLSVFVCGFLPTFKEAQNCDFHYKNKKNKRFIYSVTVSCRFFFFFFPRSPDFLI